MKAHGFFVASLGLTVLAAVLVQSPNTLGTKVVSTPEPRWSNAAAQAVQPRSTGLSSATKQQIVASYGRLPLSFEANRGQSNAQVKFISRGSGYSLFLTGTETVLALSRADGSAPRSRADLPSGLALAEQAWPGRSAPKAKDTAPTVLRMKLVGAKPAPAVVGLEELQGKSNYFLGNDPSKWRTNVPRYAKVRYHDVYPGIDLVHYGTQRQLEYDLVVAPGADPTAIRLSFQGADALEIDEQGDLVLHTAAGDVREHKPVVYQMQSSVVSGQLTVATDHGQRITDSTATEHFLDGRYVLTAQNEVRFDVGPYDPTRPLVIDPVLSYSTYLGGSGSETGFGIAVDGAGNSYVTGRTSSADFPTTPGALAITSGGRDDVFVTKIDTTKSGAASLVYSTYLGGSDSDIGSGIAVDAAANAYVTGQTFSTNFPTKNPFQATFGGGTNNSNAFIAKLNSSGSMLLYSTYLGGSTSDSGSGIAVDTAGNAYVTGQTCSTNFPTKNPLQASRNGLCDAFVAKIDATKSGDASLVYSTYLGGSDLEEGRAIAVDSSGNAYVTGSTQSSNFPTAQPLQPSIGGGTCLFYIYYGPFPCADAFVAKLNPAGSALVFSTYLGGNNDDRGAGIAVDSSGNSYVTGHTSSPNFPTKNPIQATLRSGDAFVAKLNATGSALTYSTYLGGNSDDEGRGITVDSSGNAYVAGNTSSTDFPTVFPVQVLTSGFHAFITKLNPTGSALVYSSYLGGSISDSGVGIAVDATGNAYVAGQTSSTNFPTANPLRASLNGFSDAFVSKIAPIPGPAVATSPASLSFQQQPISTTSAPQTVTLSNRGDGTLTISAIAASGDFAQTSTCGNSLATGANCTIDVTFTPTTTGTRNGTVTISDNAAGSPHTVSLVGNFAPPDFSISPSSSAATVSAGGSATSSLTIVPLNNFTGSVSLNCSGLPALSTCSFLPNPVTPGGNPVISTLTISTTAGSALLAPPFGRLRIGPRYAFWLALLGIAFVGVGIWGRKPKKERIGSFSVGLLLILVALQAGCRGPGSSVNTRPGTPPGVYSITVTGSSTSSSLQHAITFALTVR